MHIHLDTIVCGNAAGTVKTLVDVEIACKGAATRVMVGSITLQERSGNEEASPGGTYYFDPRDKRSYNAIGLKNPGLTNTQCDLSTMKMLAHQSGKELWISVAGFSSEEFIALTIEFLRLGVDGVQINFSCPNVHDKGAHGVFSQDAMLVGNILSKIRAKMNVRELCGKQVGVKFSPTNRFAHLKALADVVVFSEIVTEVVAFNAVPDVTALREDGTPALSFRPPGSAEVLHSGGMGGTGVAALTLFGAKTFADLLPVHIKTIATGGIFSAEDARPLLEAGAIGFECATAYIESGPKIFGEILLGLA